MAGALTCDGCGKTVQEWAGGVLEMRFRRELLCEPCQGVRKVVDELTARYAETLIERTGQEIEEYRQNVQKRVLAGEHV